MLLVDSYRQATLSYQYVCSLSEELISPIVRQAGYSIKRQKFGRCLAL